MNKEKGIRSIVWRHEISDRPEKASQGLLLNKNLMLVKELTMWLSGARAF